MPPCELTAAVFLAALFANYFLGAFAPVFFRAVCLVRAILFLFFIRIDNLIAAPFKDLGLGFWRSN